MTKKCLHCGSNLVEWKESNSYALIKMDKKSKVLDPQTYLPVTARLCENCNNVDLELIVSNN